MKKSISIFLLVIILLQSCVAYQKTSVSLDEATNTGKVKLIDTHGRVYQIINIEMQDSVYYGFIAKEKTVLYEAQFSGIYLQDKKKSKTQTIIFTVSMYAILTVGLGLLIVAFFKALEEDLNSI